MAEMGDETMAKLLAAKQRGAFKKGPGLAVGGGGKNQEDGDEEHGGGEGQKMLSSESPVSSSEKAPA